MSYTDHIIVAVRTDLRGQHAARDKFEARYAEEGGPYEHLRGRAVTPYAAIAMLEHAQITELLESNQMKGAENE